jgi:hypothetical protein
LAERCTELMKRQRPNQSLMFVVDEVGQFVARDVQKMLDLQAIVQSLGRVGRGRHWVTVTSQEKLGELVGGLDDRRIELARLMDRFATQVHLEPSDISEVTSRRVLSKNAAAQKALRDLFDSCRGRLTENTRMTADITLPELSAEGFVDLYPLLPYQIDLIIQVVSGLRTQGGASRHVGGANRTIIKLAQQLLINPAVDLASQSVGQLVRIDQIYDLVEGNIGGEVRAKISTIPKEIPHPLAQPVAKAICLLQYVKSIHRTAENLAATLHPSVDGDSRLTLVKEALDLLIKAHKVRLGDDGYRIPTPAEDDWERQRLGLVPKPGESSRLHAEVIHAFWQPSPSHTLFETKLFKAGLALHGRVVVEGDMPVHMHLAEPGKAFEELVADLRRRSQQETNAIFWGVQIDQAVRDQTDELFKSKEMVGRKEREARTADESALIGEEKVRLRRHQEELRRLLKTACLSGQIFFRGNDRSPGDGVTEVGKAASAVLGQALPLVFSRFKEAAAKVQKKDLDALLMSENLHGLTPVFGQLGLLRDEKGKPVFRTDSGLLSEMLARIENRASYGETASGRYLADEFAKEPFGWDFEVVRLLALALLRAGKVEVTSKSQTIDSALSVEAKETFSNNNLFRQAAFRQKVGIDFEKIAEAADKFQQVFGKEIKELEQGVVCTAIREELSRAEEGVQSAFTTLVGAHLPGSAIVESALDTMRAARRGTEANTILLFLASWSSIKEAAKRAAELGQALTPPALRDLEIARETLETAWAFLKDEPDLDDKIATAATELEDLLQRETFFRQLPAIDQNGRAVREEYERRYDQAHQARTASYHNALEQLQGTPGWSEVEEEQRKALAAPILRAMGGKPPIPQLRADRDACMARLQGAIQKLMEMVAGERVVSLQLSNYFKGGIGTEEELDAALAGVREECARLIGAGKKVIVQ